MDVIALEGSSNVGKSESLSILYFLLIISGYVKVPESLEILDNGDFSIVLERNDYKVGIITEGDYANGEHSVKKLLHSLDKFKCDMIVCACTSEKGKEKIHKFIENEYHGKFINKERVTENFLLEDNFKCAMQLSLLIEKYSQNRNIEDKL